MTLAALLTLAGLQALVAISPGPATVLCIKTSASEGARAGIVLSFGFAIAMLIWASAALLGLSLLFDVAPYLQGGLKVIGAAFLVWIGISLWRHADTALPAPGSLLPRGTFQTLRLGIITDLANPKALAYFTAVFSGVMPADPTLADAAAILAIIAVIEFVWYALVALVFSRDIPRRAYGRAKRWLDRSFGAVLAALGIRIALP
ncbi:LysE family translocator [Gymnodinialimonas sp.]